MATLADSLVSSSSRKLPIRMRPDLRARQHRYQGRIYWVVKDPVGLQYFRFEEEEFAILQMLDGQSSLDEIAERFERDFPPQTIRIEELQQFIGMLHRSGLVITDAAGQGPQLKKRRDERKSQERWATLTNILSIRFKGIDPERLLNFSVPYVRWFFTVPAMICCIAAGAVGADAGDRAVRRVSLAAAGFPHVLQRPELAVAGDHAVRDQGAARVRPRPVLQALRRRVPRDGRDVAGAHALPVLQRFRFVDAAQPLASGGDRRGRHVRRARAGVDLHVHLVVHRAGAAQLHLPERDVHLAR